MEKRLDRLGGQRTQKFTPQDVDDDDYAWATAGFDDDEGDGEHPGYHPDAAEIHAHNKALKVGQGWEDRYGRDLTKDATYGRNPSKFG